MSTTTPSLQDPPVGLGEASSSDVTFHNPKAHDLRLPIELWLHVLWHSPKSSLRAATLTCRPLRWLAQPMLFRIFTAHLDESESTQIIGRDAHTHSTRRHLAALESPHIASAITELRIIFGDAPYTPPRDQDLVTSSSLDTIFDLFPTLINLKTLVCHEVTLTRNHLLAIHRLPTLHELELQSCRSTHNPEDFPDFSTAPLKTLIFNYPYSSVQWFTNSPFMALFLQARKLTRIFAGPTDDILSAMIQTSPAQSLSILEVPVSCIQSPAFTSALAACPSVRDILLYMPIGDSHLPSLDDLPVDVLPDLESYRGPGTYAHHFTRGRNVTKVQFTLPCLYTFELCTTLKGLDSNTDVESFSCNFLCLDAEALATIYSSFPSLKKLTISGTKIDIDTLATVLIASKVQPGLEHIQLDISTGEPRLTDSWRTTISKMFLTCLVRAYPSLQTAKLVYQPQTSVVWNRPSGAKPKGPVPVDASDLWVEKEKSAVSRTNAIWDTVKYKQLD